MEQSPVARHIKQRRAELHLTQRELADKAGVDVSTVQDYERGHQRGERRGGTHVKLAQALEWPLDAFDRIAAGEHPSAFNAPPNPDPTGLGGDGFNDRIDRLLSGVERLTGKIDSFELGLGQLSHSHTVLLNRVGQGENEVALLASRVDRLERLIAS